MRLLLTLLFALALAAPACAAAQAGAPDTARLDAAVAAQMAKHGLPGVALAVVSGGEVVYRRGYGAAGARPMSPDTRAFIGSQSKSLTALAVVQLAERGRIELGAPVRRYIPWFAVGDPQASGQITVAHLLHHTSGLSDSGLGAIPPDGASPEQAVRALASARLTAPVGSTFQYFNLGYDVLAYLVEVVSGERYADYLRAHVFGPLGMARTTADPSEAGDMAWGSTRLFGLAVPAPQRVRAYEVGAGYIISTADDLARLALAMLAGGGGAVSAGGARQMLTPGAGGYGMGWFISADGEKAWHGGANETFRAEVNLYPRRGLAFALLVNEGHLLDHYVSASQLAAAVESAVLGGPEPAAGGWSVRWAGLALGALVLALCALHARNIADLRGPWLGRWRRMARWRRAADVAVSFAVPTAILLVVFSQLRALFGDRFNLTTTLANFGFAMPDVFILMLVGTLPDYAQGLWKLWRVARQR